MKIKYTKERLKSNLRMGLFFITIGIILVLLSCATEEYKDISLRSIGIGQFGAGLFMLTIYYFENRKQYLTLEKGELIKNTLFPKKIKLTEVKSIREFAGDYKLKKDNGEFVINTQIIEANSLLELRNELKKLNITWN